MTTLVVAHDIDAAIRLADIVYVLSAGPGRLLAAIRVRQPRRRLSAEGVARVRAQIAEVR